jgi:hypothetical protein
VIFYVCIAGEASNDWARRNAMIPQAGLAVLRLALAELAHHYGLCKLPSQLSRRSVPLIAVAPDGTSRNPRPRKNQ